MPSTAIRLHEPDGRPPRTSRHWLRSPSSAETPPHRAHHQRFTAARSLEELYIGSASHLRTRTRECDPAGTDQRPRQQDAQRQQPVARVHDDSRDPRARRQKEASVVPVISSLPPVRAECATSQKVLPSTDAKGPTAWTR
ncbi:hypothetical protein ACN47E_006515 [Coniothyrium glycines]